MLSATLTRTVAMPLNSFPETAVNTASTDAPYRNVPDNTGVAIYVTEVLTDRENAAGIATGTIVEAWPSSAPAFRGTWVHFVGGRRGGTSQWTRSRGAVINPEPVNGRYYRTVAGVNLLVRYNDDAHTGDRHRPTMPWSLIRGEGEQVWVIPNDGLLSLADYAYIEVEAPANVDAVTATDADVTAVRTALVVEDITVNGPTRGMAQAEDDGTVLLSPDPVVGDMYLLWDTRRWDPARTVTDLVTYTGEEDGVKRWASVGYYGWDRYNNRVTFQLDHYRGLVTPAEPQWAKLRMEVPEPTSTPEQVAVLRAQLETLQSARKEFNTALNQLASDNDWCGEYERIIEKVGMKGRRTEWEVELSVDFTFEDNNPEGSNVEDAAEERYGSSMTLTEVRYTAKMDVTLRVTAQDEDSIDDAISTSDIHDQIRDALGYRASNIDVDDYSIESTSEVND